MHLHEGTIVNMNDVKLPNRSRRYCVGKEIGGAVYLHRSYEQLLGDVVANAKRLLPIGFDYQIVKWNHRKGCVSFIQSADFDAAHEPAVGNMVTIDSEGNVRRRNPPKDPEIYHHKWLFVDEDYSGFDVEESRQRSLQWMKLEGVDRSRIGRRKYWTQHVLPKLDGS